MFAYNDGLILYVCSFFYACRFLSDALSGPQHRSGKLFVVGCGQCANSRFAFDQCRFR